MTAAPKIAASTEKRNIGSKLGDIIGLTLGHSHDSLSGEGESGQCEQEREEVQLEYSLNQFSPDIPVSSYSFPTDA